MKNKNCWLVIAGGDDPGFCLPELAQKADKIICADSGCNYAYQYQLTPDLIVGDFDSIDPQVKQFYTDLQVEFLTYSPEKDYTDTYLAINEAVARGAEKIILTAVLGGRKDHELANLLLPVVFLDKLISLTIETSEYLMSYANSSFMIEGQANQVISLIPLSPLVEGITLEGFYYPLRQETLSFGTPRGISNVLLGSVGKIFFDKGIILVVQKKES